MSDKAITNNINSAYSTVINLCKLLKPHATNIMLLPNNRILMQPIIPGIRNYMIANSDVDYSSFLYTYLSIPDISKVNTKFRKTKSEITWETTNGEEYLIVSANDEESLVSRCPVFSNQETLNSLVTATYSNVPSEEISIDSILIDENSFMYIDLGESFINDMIDKKLCDIQIGDQSILISRPFLGDMKKTEWVGYRVIEEDEYKFIIKFKQVEKLGDIYTYAAFLKY